MRDVAFDGNTRKYQTIRLRQTVYSAAGTTGPSPQVIDAFRVVQAAATDKETQRNQAFGEAGRIIPEARGEAQAILQGARGYRQQAAAKATRANGPLCEGPRRIQKSAECDPQALLPWRPWNSCPVVPTRLL